MSCATPTGSHPSSLRNILNRPASATGRPMKYVFVTGGTVSGLGKGTAISSLGVVLKAHGYRVTSIKIDPYLNVDAGTMSPYEHGECFVLDDGGEADLDLGNYERFLSLNLSSDHNITSGKIYQQVINRERKGDYLGKTVQMVPHITDAVQEWIETVSLKASDGQAGPPDVCLVELGGTIGDIESAVYLEAIQQFLMRVGPENVVTILVGLVPVLGVVGEQKTKPCQHSVKLLREAGIRPDFVFCRLEQPLEPDTKRKLSMFCQVPITHVISLHDTTNIYRVPLLMEEQSVGELVLSRLGLDPYLGPGMGDWAHMADRNDNLGDDVSIAIVGKYTGLADTYISVLKALKHASSEAGRGLKVVWVESTDLERQTEVSNKARYEEAWSALRSCQGVLVPGGFGDRGIVGKSLAATFCRQNGVPYFGICLGLQTAVISFAREEMGWEGANSAEFDRETPYPVVVYMPDHSSARLGGTMRLGSHPTIIRNPQSLASKVYAGKHSVEERHRHRYEVNPALVEEMQTKGLVFSGTDERSQRMEIIELPSHPFFLAVQFHPEYKSRPLEPSPPFLAFFLAAAGDWEKRLKMDGGVLRSGSGWKRN